MTVDYLLKVSHHPPISACHADSNKFTFLQGTLPVELQGHTRTSSMRSWFFILQQDGTLVVNSADLLLRRQMEKQILGEINGNPPNWHR
jgi:isopenicillin N synthase-like dioxygenase